MRRPAIMFTLHCVPIEGTGEQRLLWHNLVNVQQTRGTSSDRCGIESGVRIRED